MLAIGVVVDDAIVVVENVERWIEQGLSPREAAYKSMDEVTVAVIAIAFGLSAVFIPTAFISGISGQFYRQFALTIATSTLISAFNSLTLSPALAAILLKPHGAKKDLLTRLLDGLLGWFFRGFNRRFRAQHRLYERLVRLCVRRCGRLAAGLRRAAGAHRATASPRCPPASCPTRTRATCWSTAQLPDSASLERTKRCSPASKRSPTRPRASSTRMGIAGQSFLLNANGSNFASMFVILEDFHHRHGADLYGRRDRRQAAPAALPARSTRPRWACSAPRRSTAWAMPAASRS